MSIGTLKTESVKHNLSPVIEKIAADYGGVPSGGGYLIHCPCDGHNDEHQSCKVTLTDDGRILVYCHRCDQNGEHRAYDALAAKGYLQTQTVPVWAHIFQKSVPASAMALLYHESRQLGVITDWPDSLRESNSLKINEEPDREFCGLVWRVDDKDGAPMAILRILLNDECTGKAEIDNPKRLVGSAKGGHITIKAGTSKRVHVPEGPENGVAVWKNLPAECAEDSVWSAINSTNMAAVNLPSAFTEVHIWADLDPGQVGERAAKTLAQRLCNEGRTVIIHLPQERNGSAVDFNDSLEEIADSYENSKAYSLLPWEEDQVTIPDPYELREDGVYMHKKIKTSTGMQEVEIQISCTPAYVVRCARDVSTKEERVSIKWKMRESGKYHTLAVSRKAIMTTKALTEDIINKTSITVQQKNFAVFCDYLQLCAEQQTSFQQTSATTQWVQLEGKHHFVPYSDEIYLIDPGGPLAGISAAYTPSGDFRKWCAAILEPMAACPNFLVAFAFAFVSPLLTHLPGVPPFVVNIASQSGTGKTRSSHMILSAFYQSVPDGKAPLMCQMNSASLAGILQLLNFNQDLPLCFDDAQSESDEKIARVVYTIGNAASALKCTPGGALRDTTKAHSVVFITSEVDLSTKFSYDGGNARIVTIADPPFGGFVNAAQLKGVLDNVPKVLAKHYGHLGRLYVQHLADILNAGKEQELIARFEQARCFLLKDAERGERMLVDRQLPYYAAALTACTFLHPFLPKPLIAAISHAIYRHWKQALVSKSHALLPERALHTLRDYVTANRDKFKQNSFSPERPGEFQKNGNLAILYRSLVQILGEKFDAQNIVSQWKSRGWLVQGPSMAQKGALGRAVINGQKAQCIVLKKEVFDEPSDREAEDQEVPM